MKQLEIPNTETSPKFNFQLKFIIAAVWVAAVSGLFLTLFHSYLLFHSLAELFGILVAFSVFILAYHTRRFPENSLLLFIGVSLLFVGFLELLHLLSYPGMGVFPEFGPNLSTQLWMAAGYLKSISFLAAILLLRHKLKSGMIFGGFIMLAAFLLLSIFYWKIFPSCHLEGKGLTILYKASVYIISTIILLALLLLNAKRAYLSNRVFRLLATSMVCAIGAEMTLTFHLHLHGLMNLVGHLFKIASYYLIYKAVIETGITMPYELLFRDLKLKEEKLQDAQDVLSERFVVRTKELALTETKLKSEISQKRQLEAQLFQSQKMEAIGRLAGGIAHDFNNLLMVILGFGDLALTKVRDKLAPHDELEEIIKAGNQAAALTRQLLAFSRRQILSPRSVNLTDVLDDMKKMIRRIIGEDIEITAKLSPTLWKVRVDPGQMEQIIMNLVVNARDAMPGGGKLTLETRNIHLNDDYAALHTEAKTGPHVMIAISDTGEGMDEETQSHIFEPFFTTKRLGKGTGLGLSTVYGIVKQSNGNIWVYSEPGRGTTFKIYFPRDEEADVSKMESRQLSKASAGSETILLVEDNDPVRELASRVLREKGYTLLMVGSGEEALKVSEQYSGNIHLMLTDIVMPGINGKVLADHLHPIRPEMRVVFMSGYTEETIAHHSILDSDVTYLQKPFMPGQLLSAIRAALDSPPR